MSAARSLIVVAVLAAGSARAQSPREPELDLDFERTFSVAPGLAHEHLSSTGRDGRGPLNVHLLRLDLDVTTVRVALAMDQVLGQETVSAIASRHGALAAVNGGFSVSNDPWVRIHGDPNGFVVVDGEIVSEPVLPRASLGLCTDTTGRVRVSIVRPELRVGADIDGGRVALTGLNRARDDAGDAVLYTPMWGRTTLTGGGGIELVVRSGRVTAVRRAGSTIIPPDGFVISASGAAAPALERVTPGDRAERVLEVRSLDGEDRPIPIDGCSYTSAGPEIVRDGEALSSYEGEEFGDHFTRQRHPRTAVGVTRDGRTLLMVVVDGRQPELSVGMTLPELAALLVTEGAHRAYNLDGGGSSTMVVADRIVNHPSDERERRRCDALLVFARN